MGRVEEQQTKGTCTFEGLCHPEEITEIKDTAGTLMQERSWVSTESP